MRQVARMIVLRLGVAALLAGAILAPPAVAADYPFGWSAKQQGATVVQYDSGVPAERCSGGNIDQPVRAFRSRNDNGAWRVQLNGAHNSWNRRLIGPDLYGARFEHSPSQLAGEQRGCDNNVVFDGSGPRPYCPSHFDENNWLNAPYFIPDPANPSTGPVYSLNHNEFNGGIADNRAPGGAPLGCGEPGATASDRYCSPEAPAGESVCWFGSITFSVSTNDLSKCNGAATPNKVGACFTLNDDQVPPRDSKNLVATIPYKYYRDWGCNATPIVNGQVCGRNGYAAFSNVLRGEGALSGNYYFAAKVHGPLFRPDGQPLAQVQQRGVCLLRTATADLADPSKWKAWGGSDFDVSLVSGYALTDSPENHFCTPVVPSSRMEFQPWSLTYNTYLRKYMLLGYGGPAGSEGVYYMLSDDLVNWGDAQLAMTAPAPVAGESCGLDSIAYPTLLDRLDPAATVTVGQNGQLPPTANLNFDHPGRQPDLYFRQHPRGTSCGVGQGKLVHTPIRFEQRQADLDGSLTDPDRGFDSTSSGFVFQMGPGAASGGNGYGEGTQKFAAAQMYGTFTQTNPPHGIQAVSWNNRNDVWYGGAFYLSGGFLNQTGNVDIMRWDGAAGQYGGIGLRSTDHRLHLVAGTSQIGSAIDVPEGRWFWLEVHQRFGESASDAPVNEVYVDGRLVTSSSAPNRSALTGTITSLKHGFVTPDVLTTTYSWMLLDRLSVLGGEKGAVRGTGNYDAPDAPTGLTATATQTAATLNANVVSGASGYRFYRVINGVWTRTGANSNPAFVQPGLTCNTKYTYRITAYRQAAGTSEEINSTESVVSTPVDVTTGAC